MKDLVLLADVNDEPGMLSPVKAPFGDRIVTLHLCQSRHAPADDRVRPLPGRTVDALAEVARFTRQEPYSGTGS